MPADPTWPRWRPLRTMQVSASIFKAYDIRGIVGRTLSTEDAFAIGRCFGSIVARGGGKTTAIGRDGRLSSPDMAAALAREGAPLNMYRKPA